MSASKKQQMFELLSEGNRRNKLNATFSLQDVILPVPVVSSSSPGTGSGSRYYGAGSSGSPAGSGGRSSNDLGRALVSTVCLPSVLCSGGRHYEMGSICSSKAIKDTHKKKASSSSAHLYGWEPPLPDPAVTVGRPASSGTVTLACCGRISGVSPAGKDSKVTVVDCRDLVSSYRQPAGGEHDLSSHQPLDERKAVFQSGDKLVATTTGSGAFAVHIHLINNSSSSATSSLPTPANTTPSPTGKPQQQETLLQSLTLAVRPTAIKLTVVACRGNPLATGGASSSAHQQDRGNHSGKRADVQLVLGFASGDILIWSVVGARVLCRFNATAAFAASIATKSSGSSSSKMSVNDRTRAITSLELAPSRQCCELEAFQHPLTIGTSSSDDHELAVPAVEGRVLVAGDAMGLIHVFRVAVDLSENTILATFPLAGFVTPFCNEDHHPDSYPLQNPSAGAHHDGWSPSNSPVPSAAQTPQKQLMIPGGGGEGGSNDVSLSPTRRRIRTLAVQPLECKHSLWSTGKSSSLTQLRSGPTSCGGGEITIAVSTTLGELFVLAMSECGANISRAAAANPTGPHHQSELERPFTAKLLAFRDHRETSFGSLLSLVWGPANLLFAGGEDDFVYGFRVTAQTPATTGGTPGEAKLKQAAAVSDSLPATSLGEGATGGNNPSFGSQNSSFALTGRVKDAETIVAASLPFKLHLMDTLEYHKSWVCSLCAFPLPVSAVRQTEFYDFLLISVSHDNEVCLWHVENVKEIAGQGFTRCGSSFLHRHSGASGSLFPVPGGGSGTGSRSTTPNPPSGGGGATPAGQGTKRRDPTTGGTTPGGAASSSIARARRSSSFRGSTSLGSGIFHALSTGLATLYDLEHQYWLPTEPALTLAHCHGDDVTVAALTLEDMNGLYPLDEHANMLPEGEVTVATKTGPTESPNPSPSSQSSTPQLKSFAFDGDGTPLHSPEDGAPPPLSLPTALPDLVTGCCAGRLKIWRPSVSWREGLEEAEGSFAGTSVGSGPPSLITGTTAASAMKAAAK